MNLQQAKAQFLEKHLHRHVTVDMSRYFTGSKGVTCDKEKIPGFLNGINKNATQQFDIDFELGEWGFEYLNCFDNTCRCYSHTSHAECITIDDFRTVEKLTDEEWQTLINIHDKHFSITSNEETYYVEFDNETGQITAWYKMLNGEDACIKVCFDELPQPCTDYLKLIGVLMPFTYLNENKKPVTLQPSEIIALKWAQIKPCQ